MTRLALLAAVLLLAGCATTPDRTGDAPATVVYLVRHAEKATTPERDPVLTAEGEARAEALADELEGRGIRAIYSSQFRRTQDTAGPLAERLGLDVTTLPITGPDPIATVRAQARQIADDNFPYAVLVVGHSNTIPSMISELTGEPMDDLQEHEYGDLFIVRISARPSERTPTDVHVERTHFGASL